MTLDRYIIESLDSAKHDRKTFDCGVAALNDYLRERAGQDMRRHAAGCWVLCPFDDPPTVLGYYTLSNESVSAEELSQASPELTKKLPRYPKLGAILLGRLAVATKCKGQGLGRKLLFDAISRSSASEIPAPVLVVDAKDSASETFYISCGFAKLSVARLFLPIASARAGLRSLD